MVALLPPKYKEFTNVCFVLVFPRKQKIYVQMFVCLTLAEMLFPFALECGMENLPSSEFPVYRETLVDYSFGHVDKEIWNLKNALACGFLQIWPHNYVN